MNNTEPNSLQRASDILLRCTLLSFALLLISFTFYLAAGDWAYGIHARLFDISRQEFTLIYYGGMGLLKTLALVLFLIPYLAIRLVLRKGGRTP